MIRRLVITSLIFASWATAQTSGLTVSVQDATKKAVVGARVTIYSVPIYDPSAPNTTPAKPTLSNFNASAKTGANGVAVFSSVPVGAYHICSYPVEQSLVDSCSWVARPQLGRSANCG